MLIATAGHIDHGKTSLVRALTGVETDRSPEERARGISIDLGFAYWRPAGGRLIGFVDVPGHERFVRTMLAGVCAVDYSLLVVAADDGVMPQTIEHLQILDILGIARAAVAITKIDRVGDERAVEVAQQVSTLLAGTTLRQAMLFAVCVPSGAGIAQLAAHLTRESLVDSPRAAAGRSFRMAIDRAFTVTGAGTVVTGTVTEGAIEVDAQVVIAPSGLNTRVRGMQSAGSAVGRALAGQRCALNLAHVELGDVGRGDWLVMPSRYAPTSQLEVSLQVLPACQVPIRHGTSVHLHVATADIMARILLDSRKTLSPGEATAALLILDRPTSAAVGDRFVIRDQSGRTLIGGGRVVDPFPPRRRRGSAAHRAVSAAMQLLDPARSLQALLASPEVETQTPAFERRFNLEADAAAQLYAAADALVLDTRPPVVLSRIRVAGLQAALLQCLADFHREHPERAGLVPHELKARLPLPVSAESFLALLRELRDRNLIASSGALLRVPSHQPRIGAVESQRWARALPRLQKLGAKPFTAHELGQMLGASDAAIRTLLFQRRSSGEVWHIGSDRFLLREQLAALAAAAAALADQQGGAGFTAAQYRDATGIGRNFTIELLEFLDSIGVTRRSGNVRRMRPDFALVVGHATPYAPLRQLPRATT
ncbi:MAG: selenocysteine-specific translation elongation factor [Gammaproteobacteria bacterium]|nr:selenocysteine-specific translation elongation factor [Gammaproteobacteria bacterium]